MKITKLVGVLYEENTYILEKNDVCIIIDAGARLEEVKGICGDKKVLAVLLTHGHYDHSIFCNEYAKEFDCPIYANENIEKTMTDSAAMCGENGETIDDFSRFVFLKDYEKFSISDFLIEVFYCPGHSICSQCFLIENNLFAGDVLFRQGIGRTDLKFGNKKDMLNTLCKLENLNFENLFSGHGEDSTYQDQRKNIALFKRFLSR